MTSLAHVATEFIALLRNHKMSDNHKGVFDLSKFEELFYDLNVQLTFAYLSEKLGSEYAEWLIDSFGSTQSAIDHCGFTKDLINKKRNSLAAELKRPAVWSDVRKAHLEDQTFPSAGIIVTQTGRLVNNRRDSFSLVHYDQQILKSELVNLEEVLGDKPARQDIIFYHNQGILPNINVFYNYDFKFRDVITKEKLIEDLLKFVNSMDDFPSIKEIKQAAHDGKMSTLAIYYGHFNCTSILKIFRIACRSLYTKEKGKAKKT